MVKIRHPVIFSNWGTIQLIFFRKKPGVLAISVFIVCFKS